MQRRKSFHFQHARAVEVSEVGGVGGEQEKKSFTIPSSVSFEVSFCVRRPVEVESETKCLSRTASCQIFPEIFPEIFRRALHR